MKKESNRLFSFHQKPNKILINELKLFNITEDFIYPDMDNVAHEIMENINKE